MTLRELPPDECWELLSRNEVGRLGIVVRGYPEILPVNYGVARGRVLLRSDAGLKLRHTHFERVCFEVDDVDPMARTGWSGLLRGDLHEMDERDPFGVDLDAAAAQIRPWAGGPKDHVLVVTPVETSGRQVLPD